MRYGCSANGFRFDSHLDDYFFQVYVLPLQVSVSLSLGLVLG